MKEINFKGSLTTSWSFFFETVMVFVEVMVDVVLVTFDAFFDSTTGTDIFNAIEKKWLLSKFMNCTCSQATTRFINNKITFKDHQRFFFTEWLFYSLMPERKIRISTLLHSPIFRLFYHTSMCHH